MGLDPKHAIKHVGRLLSNKGITVWAWFERGVTFVVAAREEIVVALDWTAFDKDDPSTLAPISSPRTAARHLFSEDGAQVEAEEFAQ